MLIIRSPFFTAIRSHFVFRSGFPARSTYTQAPGRKSSRHLPVFLGAGGTLVCLLALGAENGQFLIPALGILVAGLLLLRPYLEREEEKV